MIISLFVHCFPPAKGGLEYLVGEMKRILDQKFEVHIITGQGLSLDSYKTFSNFSTDNSNNVHRLETNYFYQRLANKLFDKIIFKLGHFSPFYFGPILKYTPEIKEIIATSDLIIGAGMPTKMFYDAHRYAQKLHKKLILIPAYHNVSYYNRCLFFQKAFDYAHETIFLTDFERTQTMKNYQIPKSKTAINTYCPFTVKQIQKQIQINSKRRYNSLNPTVGYVGQICPRKNLYVFDSLLKKGFRLIFAGAKNNGSSVIEKHFKRYMSSNRLTIIYDFPESKKEEIFQKMDFFINPSNEESLGIVNFESIFYGTPIIVSRSSAFYNLFPKVLSFKNQIDDNILKKNPSQTLADQYPIFNNVNFDKFSQQLINSLS